MNTNPDTNSVLVDREAATLSCKGYTFRLSCYSQADEGSSWELRSTIPWAERLNLATVHEWADAAVAYPEGLGEVKGSDRFDVASKILALLV